MKLYVNENNLLPFKKENIINYPLAFNYLKGFKDSLLKRSNVDKVNWWLYPYPKNLKEYQKPKLIFSVLNKRGNFTLDQFGDFYFVGGGNAGGHAIQLKNNDINMLKLFLGILNSNLTTFFISKIASKFRGGYYSFGKKFIEKLPLPLELDDSKIINEVDKILQLNDELNSVQTPHEKKLIERQIEMIDKKIEKLVYSLYELNEEEIDIIENSLDNKLYDQQGI